jgi:hypothetical protein
MGQVLTELRRLHELLITRSLHSSKTGEGLRALSGGGMAATEAGSVGSFTAGLGAGFVAVVDGCSAGGTKQSVSALRPLATSAELGLSPAAVPPTFPAPTEQPGSVITDSLSASFAGVGAGAFPDRNSASAVGVDVSPALMPAFASAGSVLPAPASHSAPPPSEIAPTSASASTSTPAIAPAPLSPPPPISASVPPLAASTLSLMPVGATVSGFLPPSNFGSSNSSLSFSSASTSASPHPPSASHYALESKLGSKLEPLASSSALGAAPGAGAGAAALEWPFAASHSAALEVEGNHNSKPSSETSRVQYELASQPLSGTTFTILISNVVDHSASRVLPCHAFCNSSIVCTRATFSPS